MQTLPKNCYKTPWLAGRPIQAAFSLVGAIVYFWMAASTHHTHATQGFIVNLKETQNVGEGAASDGKKAGKSVEQGVRAGDSWLPWGASSPHLLLAALESFKPTPAYFPFFVSAAGMAGSRRKIQLPPRIFVHLPCETHTSKPPLTSPTKQTRELLCSYKG